MKYIISFVLIFLLRIEQSFAALGKTIQQQPSTPVTTTQPGAAESTGWIISGIWAGFQFVYDSVWLVIGFIILQKISDIYRLLFQELIQSSIKKKKQRKTLKKKSGKCRCFIKLFINSLKLVWEIHF